MIRSPQAAHFFPAFRGRSVTHTHVERAITGCAPPSKGDKEGAPTPLRIVPASRSNSYDARRSIASWGGTQWSPPSRPPNQLVQAFRQSSQGRDHRVIIPFGCFGPQKIPASGGAIFHTTTRAEGCSKGAAT